MDLATSRRNDERALVVAAGDREPDDPPSGAAALGGWRAALGVRLAAEHQPEELPLRAGGGQLAADTGWRLILTACLSNLVVKAGIAGALGGRRLLVWVAVPFLAAAGIGAGLLVLWPAQP